jgi:hypothetical protein
MTDEPVTLTDVIHKARHQYEGQFPRHIYCGDIAQEVERWLAARTADPGGLDVERLAAVLAVSPIHWTVTRPDGAIVMTLMLDSADEAAEHIAAEYAALTPEATAPGQEELPL